ncbi:MAG TPA: hypothetical protein VE825_17400 [Terriglobales bacterium]|jgi:uncharacterized membrane protein AbrB (regulator of aidB expression)|nr:hypothetical protein [Terriglobales bacterium]
MTSRSRYAGVIMVLGASLGAAAGLLFGQLDRFLAVGIAMVGILIGSAIARGSFHSDPRLVPDPGSRPTTNDQRPVFGKE